MIGAPAIFRFDADRHQYFYNDVLVPSITQLLDLGGLVNGKDYFTEASRERGQEVHRLCMDYELGVLDLASLDSPFRGYALGYVAAVKALRPKWEQIEVADVHPVLRFGGRTDRTGRVFARATVAEIKSAAKAKHHPIQTALQAILKSGAPGGVPAEMYQRLTIYVKNTGKFTVEEHTDPRDFDVARDLIRRFC